MTTLPKDRPVDTTNLKTREIIHMEFVFDDVNSIRDSN